MGFYPGALRILLVSEPARRVKVQRRLKRLGEIPRVGDSARINHSGPLRA